MSALSFDGGELHADGIAVADLARAAGTPLFVYSAGLIRDRLGRLRAAFDGMDPRIHYAVKANSNAALLRLMIGAGAGFDIVSGGELLRALRVGADPEHFVFAGAGKQEWEIRLALRAGIGMFNVESEAELDRLRALASGEDRPVSVALRINPDVAVDTHAYIMTGGRENKFGITLDAAAGLVPRIHDDRCLRLEAYHVHLGSLLLEPEPYVDACRLVMDFLDADEGHRRGVRSYDVGGGFGSRGPFAATLDLEALGDGLRDLLVPRGLSLVVEPGRLLVGDAGVLVTKLIWVKTGLAKDFYVVDAAMNDLVRPALYGAEHGIRAVRTGAPPHPRPVDVVGPVCESADFLGLGRELPELGPGDLLAVLSAGAYGFTMASNYNSRPLAAEILCGDGPPRLIRSRQRIEDLWRDEVDEGLDLSRRAGDPPFRLPDPFDDS